MINLGVPSTILKQVPAEALRMKSAICKSFFPYVHLSSPALGEIFTIIWIIYLLFVN
jgi:hypothetical protein